MRSFIFDPLKAMAVPLFILAILITNQHAQGDDSLSKALAAVRAVDTHGQGHESAVKAMKKINAASIEQIPEILSGMDDANPISLNWFRSAVISIVGRGGELPRTQIKTYFDDQSHNGYGRLLAFDLLTNGNDELAENLIPTLIDDPSLPLRAKAVAALIKSGESETDPVKKIGTLAYAFEKARDVSQVQELANLLRETGVQVDLQKQFGFLNTWHLVGSFDNKDQAGFDVAYGPEIAVNEVDLEATYDDTMAVEEEKAKPASWSTHATVDETGVVDLNEKIGKVKGATAYAYTTFTAQEDCTADIRIGSPNATKIWVNGELVMSNEIYHNSNPIDKFIGKANLKTGENKILVKVCQNEQTDNWAQDWAFQIRICDATGKRIAPAEAAASY